MRDARNGHALFFGVFLFVLACDRAPVSAPAPTPLPLGSPPKLVLLAGPPGDPANRHIPNAPAPEPSPADIVAPSGMPISVRDLHVNFKDAATVGEVNALLQSLHAEVAGGLPAGKLLSLRLVGPSDLERVLNAQAVVLASPLVSSATINFAAAPDSQGRAAPEGR